VLPVVLGNATPISDRVRDAFVTAGGSCVDTGWWYGEKCERALGSWLERRGLRGSVRLVGKGAHPPACRPEHVRPQLEDSLERLGVDRIDLYLLHRDDLSVPVGEWASALADELAAGRVGAIGASNWTIERYDAFGAYADAHGLTPFSALSNHLSLARPVEPAWPGCRDVCDPESLAWLERTQTPLLAWSAQARGFFAGREDEEFFRAWASPENVEQRGRVVELAAGLGVPPAAAALAWLLARPFPAFAVVGPRSEDELAACLQAADIELEAPALAFLDRGTLLP
jgi:aryl-alcohol dehydrogenase-like predicted oxidoreductase